MLVKMDDEILRSLWEASDEDIDPKRKKEVMRHLMKMIASVECPKEGESTSNLYRILVKRLQGQVSQFGSDIEVVDCATKKLAKWVEGIVKEAYYRKHRKMQTKSPQNEEVNKSKLQLIKTKHGIPRTVVVDGKKYKIGQELNEEIEEDSTFGLRIHRRPTIKPIKKKEIIHTEETSPSNSPPTVTLSQPYAVGQFPLDEVELIKVPRVAKVVMDDQRVALIKSGRPEVIVDQGVQVSALSVDAATAPSAKEILDKYKSNLDRDLSISAKCIDGSIAENLACASGRSSAPLIRNWSSWMINLTKKAKNLVRWDNSVVDDIQDPNVREATNSDVVMQEKWNKLRAAKKNAEEKKTSRSEDAGTSSKKQAR